MIQKRYISYQEYGLLLDQLTKLIRDNIDLTNIKFVYGPPRGGLPIAVHVAHHLDLQLILNDRILKYDLITSTTSPRILIVDDICDSGETLAKLLAMNKNIKTATLFKKPRATVVPDVYVEEVSNDTWIVFPWEKDDNPDKDYMIST